MGAGLYKAACAGKVDGEVVDLRTPLTKDCNLEILTFSEEEGKKHIGTQRLMFWLKRCKAVCLPDAKIGTQTRHD
ncbi:MAG: TGS domain-containing protein [Eubacteriales bacterium]